MPQAIPWVISLFQGAAFGGGLAGAAAGVAANAALAMAVNAAVTNNTKTKEQGGLIDLTLDSAAPRQLVIGKRMVGGVLVDWYLGGSNNVKLYLPVYLSEGPCGQITRVFAGGRVVYGSPLVHGTRTAIPDFRSGGERLWVTYYDGRVGQTADSVLVSLGQGWTSFNKMTGCAWVLIECQWDSDNMRSPPSLSFEMEGAKLYDRRLDTTAGGSGSQRANNPATWTWTDNPAVALDHFMLGRYLGDVRTMGIGLEADDVPYDRFAAQANVCDEDVDLLAGGTHKRYRANGVISAAEDYASIVTKLCGAMAARPADFGGRFGVIGVESRTPVMTIDDADVIADTQEIYQPKRSWSSLVGAVEGRYQDPAQLYQPTDFPRVTDAAWETEDGGEPKVLTLDLEFETNVERAQRLALLRARMERRQATLRGTYPLWTVELERGDWFIRTGPRWGDGKTFEVVERIIDPATYTVTIVAQEVDASDSAWDESVVQDGPPVPTDGTAELYPVEAPVLTVTDAPVVGVDTTTPAIAVAWEWPAAPEPGFADLRDHRVKHIFIEVYQDSDSLKVATALVNIPDDDNQVIIQGGIADAVLYNIRARFMTQGIYSPWSAMASVTTGAAVPVDWGDIGGIPDVLVTLQTTVDALSQLVLSAMVRVDETRARLGELGRVGGVPLGTTFIQLRSEVDTANLALATSLSAVAVRVGDAEALIVSEQLATASRDAAAADALTLAEARLSGLEQGTSGQATAFNLLSSRVARNEDTLTIQASSLTQVAAQLLTAQNDILARAVVTDALDAHITSVEGRVTAHSTRIALVEASVGGVSASVATVSSALATTTGQLNAMYGVRGVAGSSEFEFYAVATDSAPSKIRLRAAQIELAGSVLIDGTLTTTKVADFAINEITVSEILTNTALPTNAAFQLQDSIVFVKSVASSTIRVRVQMVCVLSSGGPVQIDMRLKRNGVQVGIQHGFYMVAFGTWAADWVVQGGAVGASTWTVEARVHRSGVGATGGRVDASIFELQEVKK